MTTTTLRYHLYTLRLGDYAIYRWLDSQGRTAGPFWQTKERALQYARECLGPAADALES